MQKDVRTLENLIDARAWCTRYWLELYEQIAEPNVDKMKAQEGEFEKVANQYNAFIERSIAQTPALEPSLRNAAAAFNQVAIDAKSVRDAAIAGNNTRAMELMRSKIDPELVRARAVLVEVIDAHSRSLDQRAAELAQMTRHTIAITWIIISVGLVISFAFALYVIQREVVDVVLSFRGRILDVAENRFDQPIADLNRPNEIGEMSRALFALQNAAKERELQRWVKSEVAATAERLQTAEDEGSLCADTAVENFRVDQPGLWRSLFTESRQ